MTNGGRGSVNTQPPCGASPRCELCCSVQLHGPQHSSTVLPVPCCKLHCAAFTAGPMAAQCGRSSVGNVCGLLHLTRH